VIKLKPDHLQALENLCVSYFSAKQYDQAISAGQKALEIDSNELWVMGYIIVACVLTGRITKANEISDKLIAADNSKEEVNRALYFLNQEIAKNPALQGAQEVIKKLEDAQQDTMSVSIPGETEK
jgi:tetratricopeptide (TPR) repeat protein